MRIKGILHDSRVDCLSVMTEMSVGEYLKFVEHAYTNRGGIDGQREQLRTTSAIRIRKRMGDDFLNGAILPPVVVGLVVTGEAFKRAKRSTAQDLQEILNDIDPEDVSIIDGMQRTTAIKEIESEYENISERTLRVELWVSRKTNSLIYRMLVLNSGQVPWNLRRQIEVVFSGVLSEIKKNVTNIEIKDISGKGRRTKGGQFQADDIIELFLAFGARKEKIDTKERLADEFSRLDFIEATSEEGFTSLFFESLSLLVSLDIAFDRYTNNQCDGRFKHGKDIFSSQPASVGFITALAIEIYGRPGSHSRGEGEHQKKWETIKNEAYGLIDAINKKSKKELGSFLELELLNSVITSKKTGKIGEFEREFFVKAFQVLIEEHFSVLSLAECWRAY